MRNALSGNVPKLLGKRPLPSSRLKKSNASVRPRTPRRRPLNNALRRSARSRLLSKHNAAPNNSVLNKPSSNAYRLNNLLKKRSGAPRSKKPNKRHNSISKPNKRRRTLSVALKSRKRRRLVSGSRQSKLLNRQRIKKSAECRARHRVRNDRLVSSHAIQDRTTPVGIDEVLPISLAADNGGGRDRDAGIDDIAD